MISVIRMTDEVKRGLQKRDRRILRLILENEKLRKRVLRLADHIDRCQVLIQQLRAQLKEAHFETREERKRVRASWKGFPTQQNLKLGVES